VSVDSQAMIVTAIATGSHTQITVRTRPNRA
jgi:hypothetical protein